MKKPKDRVRTAHRDIVPDTQLPIASVAPGVERAVLCDGSGVVSSARDLPKEQWRADCTDDTAAPPSLLPSLSYLPPPARPPSTDLREEQRRADLHRRHGGGHFGLLLRLRLRLHPHLN